MDVPRLHRLVRAMRWLPRRVRLMVGRMATANASESVKQKMGDILGGEGTVLSLYFQRRRVMSNLQLNRLGIRCGDLGLLDCFMPAEAINGFAMDPMDVVAGVSRLESRYYMGNVLLRDSDTNGMAHGLEIRVPMLDQRMLELMYDLPGDVVLPAGRPAKHLLREAFAHDLRPELLNQRKRGFVLPIRRWMRGSLREICQEGLAFLKGSNIVDAPGVDSLWSAFMHEPESPIWSRAFTLCVLGLYVKRMSAV